MINYAEPRAEVKSGIDCEPEYAREQFKATREIFNKTDGTQAHQIYQSFKPGEITAQKANEIGQELARQIAPNHEAVVYTHVDTAHTHNHIIINSVNFENGKKLSLYGEKTLKMIREKSDTLCKEHGLSLITPEQKAEVRYTMAEKRIMEKGGISWKDQIRKAIDYEKINSKSYAEFKENLTNKYDIKVHEGKKGYISYKHPEQGKAVSGARLGDNYERGTIENEFRKHLESREENTRGTDDKGIKRDKTDDYLNVIKRENREHSIRNATAIKSSNSEQRKSQGAKSEAIPKPSGNRQTKDISNSEHQRLYQTVEQSNGETDRGQQSEFKQYDEGQLSALGEPIKDLSRDREGVEGSSIPPKIHSEPNLEGKSQTILDSDAINFSPTSHTPWGISASKLDDVDELENELIGEIENEPEMSSPITPSKDWEMDM